MNPVLKDDLEKNINVCLDENYFLINDEIFYQNDGLAMESPLSPLLAELYMSNLEKHFFSDTNRKRHIKQGYRYVDDIICLWTGTDRQLSCILKYLNYIDSKIKFTMKVEKKQTAGFVHQTPG